MGHLWPQRILGIGIGQQRQDGQKHLGNGEGRTPGPLQNIEADHSALIDIGVIDLGGETDLGGLEGVITGKVDADTEDTATKGTFGRSHDHTSP